MAVPTARLSQSLVNRARMKSPWITTFAGNSGLKKIILNENWSGDEQPLHKEWKHGPYTFYGGITGERC